ncbi:MAG: hypothetical protein E7559_08570 [Ruminococcaceae bacterium]|nr:hypothetical protein [Oscillospiraceae bacterium]
MAKPGRRIRTAALITAIAVLTLGLVGCGLQNVIESTALYQRLNPPCLEQSVTDGAAPPVIVDCANARGITRQLAEHFGDLTKRLNSINRPNKVVDITYQLAEQDSGIFILSSELVGSKGGRIALPDVEIYSDGTCIISQPMPDLLWLNDRAFALSFLYLQGMGVTLDPERYGDSTSPAEMCGLMLECYRCAGGVPDLSRFAVHQELSEYQLSLAALGLCDIGSSRWEDTEPLSSYEYVWAASALLERLYVDVCGMSSTVMTLDDLSGITDVLLRSYRIRTPEGEPCQSWYDAVLRSLVADRRGIVPENDGGQPVSRQQAAMLFVRMHETVFGEIDPLWYAETLEDIDDAVCAKAVAADLMSTYPSSSVFSPYCDVWGYTAPSMARDFVCAFVQDWYADSEEDVTDLMDYANLVSALGELMMLTDGRRLTQEDVYICVNDRDYDWYMWQHNTGEYSAVNCMPSIAAMAIKWYWGEDYPVSVEGLRNAMLEECDGGWYTAQVMDSLTMNGVPYDTSEEIPEGIIRALDNGAIVLTQMSEAAIGESGHCFVIYGYRRLGDSVQFYVHDPGITDEYDMYGMPVGKAMLLDGQYVSWIINRITFYTVVVGNTALQQ